MELDKIKTFITTVECGSLSKAAEKLGYTTSGVSRSVASLEEETGFPLLMRGKKGVLPTSEAEQLIPLMRELIYNRECYERTVQELHGLVRGTLTIGVAYAAYFKLIASTLKVFTELYPNVKIRTIQKNSTELLLALNRHEIDFAVMTKRDCDYRFMKLLEDKMVACVPEEHASVKNGCYLLIDYAKDSMVAPYPEEETDYSRSLAQYGIKPNIQYSTLDVYAAYCMVEAGLGVALFNNLELMDWHGKVKLLPTEPEIKLEIGVHYREKRSISKAANCFLDMLKQNINPINIK